MDFHGKGMHKSGKPTDNYITLGSKNILNQVNHLEQETTEDNELSCSSAVQHNLD